MKLFWNRAELKKETAQIRRERDLLAAKLSQRESASLKVQQRLEQLEGMLADPEQAASVSVYYQLRGIWQHCRRRLASLVHDLKVHQADAEFQEQSNRFRSGIESEKSALVRPLGAAEAKLSETTAEIEAIRAEHAQTRQFWRFFRRRTLAARLDALLAEQASAAAQVERCKEAIHERDSQPDPVFAGLSLEGKRKINLAIIALAQELFVHFRIKGIAEAARDATSLSLSGVRYGDPEACRKLGVRIQQAFEALQVTEELPQQLQRRSGYLAQRVTYARPTDTVPVADSLATIAVDIAVEVTDIAESDSDEPLRANILADGYWDIQRALID